MTGRDLGHYRIEAQLGAGGMGAVYRAVDLRTSQIVALKTLLRSKYNDVEQRKRFQQEARLASSLKHPNIISIHEIGSAELDGESLDYIAMELVDGETLDQITGNRPLPEKQAIDYGIQIAAGLAAAHSANIVHRDLKPSNIMVSREGVVKILDFGLAKWTDPIQPDSYSETKSVQIGLTMAGSIVGSVAYMSPEQAEGKPLDARTDVFSFGSVMYRIASGKEPFTGTSHVATLSAVLLKQPEPLEVAVPGISSGFESIIRKCIRKAPEKRWQSMADLRLSLEDLRDDGPAHVPVAAPASNRRHWLMASAGFLAGLAPAAYFATRRQPPATFQRLTFRRGDILSAQFAPRGEVVYTAKWDGASQATYSSVPGSREARDLALPSTGRLLSVNSNGEALLLNGDGLLGTLSRIGLGGSAARPVLEDVFDAKWGTDGSSIALVRRVDGKFRLEYPVGNVLVQSEVRPPSCLRLHPSDGTIAFFDFDNEVGDYDLKTVDAGKQVRLLSRGWRTLGRLGWSPDGKEVWMSAGRPGDSPLLTAVTRDGKERVLAQLPGFMILHDVAADGRLLAASVRSKVALRAMGSLAKSEVDLGWFDASLIYDISPDGTTVLSVELAYGEGRNAAIYLRKTDDSPAIRIGYGNRPALSPDGKSVVCIFQEQSKSSLKIWPTGAGEEKTLATAGMKYDYAEWFPDQTRLLVSASQPGKALRTYWRSIHGDELHPVTPEGVRASKVSPDGRWAVAKSEDKFRAFPVDSGAVPPKELGKALSGDQLLRWTADGKGLFLVRPTAGGVEVVRLEVASGRRETVRGIRFPEEGAEFYSLVISPDAKWYAYSYQQDLAELYLVRGIQ